MYVGKPVGLVDWYICKFSGKSTLLQNVGHFILSNNSENWWTLDLEVESIKGSKKNIMIGTFQNVNGDVIFDPRFDVELTMNGDKIAGAEIMYYMSQNLFDVIEIDEEDIMYSCVGITSQQRNAC